MNKTDLINSLLEVLSTKKEAIMATDKIFLTIKNALRKGEKVVISGFGSFNVKLSPSRKYRIPKTDKYISIPAKYKIKFKPSKNLIK
jgi:nucleoid DNA-binding protein